jgi:PAS domain S-box-containing protein
VVVDEDGRITGFNPAAESIFGRRKRDAMGQDLADLLIPEHRRDAHRAGFERLVETGSSRILGRRVKVEGMRADGTVFPVELVVSQIDDDPPRFAAVLRDTTEEVARENALAQISHENEQILQSAGDGIYRIDLDGRISYANPAAAKIVGMKVEEMIGKESHALLHHSHEDGSKYPLEECPIRAARMEGRVTRATTEVFWRADGTCFPVDYTSAPIREGGRIVGAVCVFADITEQRARENELRERAEWTYRIQSSLRHGLFDLHAQPIFAIGRNGGVLPEGRPVMRELLVRMKDPGNDGLILPGDFIPQAEQFGLISEIDRWVAGQAALLTAHGPVAVNFSGRTLSDPATSRWLMREVVERSVKPQNLVFEITETAALRAREAAVSVLEQLASRGCGIALDDFGTGYGSFLDVKRFPVRYLKIDREFVDGLRGSPKDQQVVSSIVTLAKKFNLLTIAEGVEREEDLQVLRDLGVHYAQGFLLGRPAPL